MSNRFRTFFICAIVVFVDGISYAQWQLVGIDSLKVYALSVIGGEIWAGTDTRGVYVSTNGGTTWTQRSVGLHSNFVKTIVSNGGAVFAGSNSGGVSISTNSGASWQNASTGLPPPGVGVHWLSAIGTTVYAGTNGSGVYRTTNSGANWEAVNSGLTNNFAHAMAVSGTTLLAGTGSTTADGGVFSLPSGGGSWSSLSGTQFGGLRALAVNGPNIFAGCNGTGVFASTNSGTSWTQRNSGLTTTTARALVASGTLLFAGTNGGGIFMSTNNAVSWNPFNGGLGNLFVLSMCANGTYAFAGTNEGIYRYTFPLSVRDVDHGTPRKFSLGQNYPNPFNPTASITYQIPGNAHVTMKLFDVAGREVLTLVEGERKAGEHTVDVNGTGLASGVYFYRLQAGQFLATKKLVLSR